MKRAASLVLVIALTAGCEPRDIRSIGEPPDSGCANPCGEACCPEGQPCDPVTNQCAGCQPESDADFCQRLQKNCGAVSAPDNCGESRTADCGTCTAPETCGPDNVCGCESESQEAFCARMEKQCGPVEDLDNCLRPRSVEECGPCAEGFECAEGACVEICEALETDEELCDAHGKTCGSPELVDSCGKARAVESCGTCDPHHACEDAVCVPLQPPDNDRCAGAQAIDLTGGSWSTTGTTRAATRDGTMPCGEGGGRDVFYHFTLDESWAVVARVTRLESTPAFRPRVALSAGCLEGESLEACATEANGEALAATERALPPGTYYVVVAGEEETAGDFELRVQLVTRPSNDDCSSAMPLVLDGVSHFITGSGGATRIARDDLTGSCAAMPGGDMVFAFELAANASLQAIVTRGPSAPPSYEPSVFITRACGGAHSEEMACGTAQDGIATASTPFAAPGVYYVVVDSTSAIGGEFSLELRAAAVRDADFCAAAATLVFDAEGVARVLSDTTAAGDDDQSSCSDPAGSDLVYAFEVPAAMMRLLVDVTPLPGSALQPAVSLRRDCPSPASEDGCAAQPSATAASLERRNLPAGTYYLWVDSTASTAGAFGLTVALSPLDVPENDLCTAATPLSLDAAGKAAVTGTTAFAFNDASGSCGALDGPDVVYRLHLESRLAVEVKVTRDAAAPAFVPAVFLRASCAAGAEQRLCATGDAESGTVLARSNSVPAGDHFLFVDGVAGTEGAFFLEVGTAPAVENLDCSSALLIPVDAGTGTASLSSNTRFSEHSTASTCMPEAKGGEVVFALQIPGEPHHVTVLATPTGEGSVVNLSLRKTCNALDSEMACAHSADAGATGAGFRLERLPAGIYYLWVDSPDAATSGPFDLSVKLSPSPPIASNDTCQSPLPLEWVDGVAQVSGDTDAARPDYDGACGTSLGADLAYRFALEVPQKVEIEVAPTEGSTLVPVVYLRRTCDAADGELGCGQGESHSPATPAALAFPWMDQGTYFVVVDSRAPGESGPFTLRVALSPPEPIAANDRCESAEKLSFLDGAVVKEGYTGEGANDYESACSAPEGRLDGPDLVYWFELDQASRVTATLSRAEASPSYRPAVSIRKSCEARDEVACALEESPLTATLAPGAYYVFVDGVATGDPATAFGRFKLHLVKETAGVAADGCGNPGTLAFDSEGVARVQGSLAGATQSGNGSCHTQAEDGTSASGNDLVYQMTLATARRVTVTLGATTGTGFAPVVYLRKSCSDPTSEVGPCHAAPEEDATVSLTVEYLPAGTWFVWVDSFWPDMQGDFTLTVETSAPEVSPPAHDVCLHAQTLRLDGVGSSVRVHGETWPAVNDYAGPCSTWEAPYSGPDLAYTLEVGQASRVYAVVARQAWEYWFPVLSLRRDCASDARAANLGCVLGRHASSSALVVDLSPGTYSLIVDGTHGESGTFTLDLVARASPPSNDGCAAAEPLAFDASGLAVAAGTTEGMADDAVAGCFWWATGGDVVYTFTTPSTAQDATIEILPDSEVRPVVFLRTSCGDAQTEVACSGNEDDFNGPRLQMVVRLEASTQYFLWVESAWPEKTGPFVLRVQTAPRQPAPAHDACAGAVELTPDENGWASVRGTTLGATNDQAGGCAREWEPHTGPDVVYKRVLQEPATVTATVHREPFVTNFWPAVYLRAGCGAGDAELACSAETWWAPAVTSTLMAGTYYIVVDGINGSFGDFTLEVSLAPPVQGDHCQVALELDLDEGPAEISGATHLVGEDGEASCVRDTAGDMVYTFTTTREQTLDIQVTPEGWTDFRPVVSVRKSCEDAGDFSNVACTYALDRYQTAYLKVPRLPPGTYYVWVDSYSAWDEGTYVGTVALSEVTDAPAHQSCSAPFDLDLSTGFASLADETWYADKAAQATCASAYGPDLVYRFTLAAERKLTARVTPDASSPWYHPVVYVRTSCETTSDLDEVTCAPMRSGVATAVVHRLPPGTYYLWVDGSTADPVATPGRFQLDVMLEEPQAGPANESCGTAAPLLLAGNTTTVSGTTAGAQNEAMASEACAPGSKESGDVVYSLTLNEPQKISVTLNPAEGFSAAVYIRDACGSLLGKAKRACASGSGGPFTATLSYAPAGTYWIWVDGNAPEGSSGALDLTVALDAAIPPPANDTCAGAKVLTRGVAEQGSTVHAYHDYGDPPFSQVCSDAWTKPLGAEVVYHYVPTTGGPFTVKVTDVSAEFDPVLWYALGACGPSGACSRIVNDGGPGEPETLTVDGYMWAPYFIYVDTVSAAAPGGTFTIQVE